MAPFMPVIVQLGLESRARIMAARDISNGMATPDSVWALRISLMGGEPEIWRRFLVPCDITLMIFHEIIQTVMGWQDNHLFEFHLDHGRFGTRHPEFQDTRNPVSSARSAILRDVISTDIRQFQYVYDMGDYWVHEIVLEEVLSNDTGETFLQCVGGANQCPPEDIGGVGGYEEFLEAIANPSHEEYEYYIDVHGDEFDPGYFDINEVNKRLQKIKNKLRQSKAREQDKFHKGNQ